MEWFSRLAEWANQNEGLLQVLAMLGGMGTLLVSLRRQRAGASARELAREPVPAKLLIRPLPEGRANLLSVLASFGGRAQEEGDGIVATFADADEAARAALEVEAAVGAAQFGQIETIICEADGPIPVVSEDARGSIRGTDVIRRALLDAADLRVDRSGAGAVPFIITRGTPYRRVRRWALPAVGAALVAVGAMSLFGWPGAPRPSSVAGHPEIAVLAFEDQSDGADEEYFSDGVTQDVISALGRFSNLIVMSWDAVLPYKGVQSALDLVKQELGVRYVVRGAVRRSGDRVRVTVRLTDAARGVLLWSERYDQMIEDIFEVQDKITQAVVGKLAVKLTSIERERSFSKPTDNLAAYDYVLRGRQLLKRRTRSSNFEARKLFEKAIALDPNYSAAHARLADTYHNDAADGWTEWPEQALERGLESAQRAIALDGGNPRAHAVLGRIYSVRGQQEIALNEIDLAIDLNPNDPYNHGTRGTVLVYLSRPEEAILSFETALRHDPNLEAGHFSDLGTAYYLANRFDDAIRTLEASVARDPDFSPGLIILAAVYAEAGRDKEARRAAAEVRRLNPFFDVELFSQFGPMNDPVHRTRVAAALREAGLE